MSTKMKHCIDPTIDFAFKILFGSQGNEPIVIHFLNSVLKPLNKITKVTIKNPFNERDFKDDKLSIVDVKVEDQDKHTYQIEIQLTSPVYLKHRMLLNWAQIYSKQMKKSATYNSLKPVVAIWLLTENFDKDPNYHHHYQLIDQQTHKKLSDHCSIHLLELKKWRLPATNDGKLNDEHIWPYFFINAHAWLNLPTIADTSTMRLAMTVLKHISDESIQYDRYMARQRYLMDERTDKEDFEKEKQLRLEAEQRADELQLKSEEQQLRADEQQLKSDEQLQRALEIEKTNKQLIEQIKKLESK